MKFTEYMFETQGKLVDAGLPINDLNILAEYVYGESFQWILRNDPEIDEHLEKFEELINLVVNKKVPIAYIVGFEYFYGRRIIVNENCLIPRTETEELVYHTVNFVRKNFKVRSKLYIADVCTGSGIVGLSVYMELCRDYNITLVVSDISKEALEVCEMNMKEYNIPVEIVCGDALEPIEATGYKFDIILANPPYIPSEEFVEDIVKKHEPNIALFGGTIGSEIHLRIIKNLNKVLADKFYVGFEMGEGQSEILMSYVKEYIGDVNMWKNYDMFSRERNIFFTNHEGVNGPR